MASPTRWTWVWASSGSWWWIGKSGVLQSMELHRVRHIWMTELICVLQDKTNSINRKPGLQFGHRLLIASVCVCPEIIGGNPEVQSLKSYSWNRCADWDSLSTGTLVVLWHRTSQHWLSLDAGQNPIWWCILCSISFCFKLIIWYLYYLFVYNEWLILLTNPLSLRQKWKLSAKHWFNEHEFE